MSPLAKLTIQCDDPWFTHIKNGSKRVEGRKGQPKYKDLAAGDLVQFRCTQEPKRDFLAHVERVDFYESLEAYLEGVGISTALPSVSIMEDALKIYSAWSTREEIERLGFVAIWLKPL